jgi:hypothetical protein
MVVEKPLTVQEPLPTVGVSFGFCGKFIGIRIPTFCGSFSSIFNSSAAATINSAITPLAVLLNKSGCDHCQKSSSFKFPINFLKAGRDGILWSALRTNFCDKISFREIPLPLFSD